MRKLLIADCSEEYRLALEEALRQHYQVLSCRSGMEALALLRQEQPEILVLDLMLPELDGLSLLERACASGLHPIVLAATPIFSEYVYSCAQRLGIEYLVRKPCDIDALVSRIQDLCHKPTIPKPNVEPVTYVTALLLSLGVSPKHDGFAYLREAIILLSRDPSQSVTKLLYPEVGRICGCKKDNVERSIRTAIDSAWKKRDKELWLKYFPNADRRPSNAIFLSRMVEALLLEEA